MAVQRLISLQCKHFTYTPTFPVNQALPHDHVACDVANY